jgi:hypothetical protein
MFQLITGICLLISLAKVWAAPEAILFQPAASSSDAILFPLLVSARKLDPKVTLNMCGQLEGWAEESYRTVADRILVVVEKDELQKLAALISKQSWLKNPEPAKKGAYFYYRISFWNHGPRNTTLEVGDTFFATGPEARELFESFKSVTTNIHFRSALNSRLGNPPETR